jgi:hypothetical protein
MNEVALETLTLATFLPLTKTRFRVQIGPGSVVELELTEATGTRGTRPSGAADNVSFSLCFSGPADPVLEQRMHVFEHDQIGRFNLFIVFIGRMAGVPQYEAVFNRAKNAGFMGRS